MDVSINGSGGGYIVTTHTRKAHGWVNENVAEFQDTSFPVEGINRMEDIARGMLKHGLAVEHNGERLSLVGEDVMVAPTTAEDA